MCLYTMQLQGMVGAVPTPSPPCPVLYYLPPKEGGTDPSGTYCTVITSKWAQPKKMNPSTSPSLTSLL